MSTPTLDLESFKQRMYETGQRSAEFDASVNQYRAQKRLEEEQARQQTFQKQLQESIDRKNATLATSDRKIQQYQQLQALHANTPSMTSGVKYTGSGSVAVG